MGSRRGMGRLTVTVPSPMRFKRRPSAYNACIGGALKGASYSKPAINMGGKRDKRIQDAFKAAVNKCKK